MNNNAAAAREKYAASTITLARAWLFVMRVSCAWKIEHTEQSFSPQSGYRNARKPSTVSPGLADLLQPAAPPAGSPFLQVGGSRGLLHNDGLRLDVANHLGAGTSHGGVR
jgi:hypothetical protein